MRLKAKTISVSATLTLGLLLLAGPSGCGEGEQPLPPVQEKGDATPKSTGGGPAGGQNAPPKSHVPKPSEK